MKKLYILLSFFFLTHFVNAQFPSDFIMTWEVGENPELGISGLDITIPTMWGNNNYVVEFGDGTVLSNQTGSVSHTYSTAGTYTVTIWGYFDNISFNFDDENNSNNNNNRKLKSIEQWGNNQWALIRFNGCENLIINATDAPILNSYTNVTFGGCISLNQDINHWDVSNVTNMADMFWGCSSFNQPLDNWDVSNVTNMGYMFSGCSSFNQPLDNWDVSNVADMKGMFYNATSFNQPLNNWNVSNVTTTGAIFYAGMFQGATSFNQPLDNWDVSNVTNMNRMFQDATSFNQPLNDWNVSNVTSMLWMFREATSFSQPLSNWNISNVNYIHGMFTNASSFNQDLSNWNFNNNLLFSYSNSSPNFIGGSGIDSINYDLLLNRFAQLGLQNKAFEAYELQYCDLQVRNYLINNKGWYIYGDSLSENCGDNTISGNIFFDENNNGCDANDVQPTGIFIKATNENSSYLTFSSNGTYTLNVFEGTNTINLLNLPDYFSYTPVDTIITIEGIENSETLDFCLTSDQIIEDLNIALLPVSEARPGFEATYQLVVQNIGTQTMNNVLVSLDFDNTKQSFVSATPNTSSVTTNQLNFEIVSLQPFTSSVINFTMQTFTPPTVNGGDVLNFTASVTPNTNDYTPNDNTFELAQIVVNSYDPNDKQILQGSEIYIDSVDEYLHYIVRFQNTGTASAVNVRIEDTLHESLDWNTIQILNSSHDFRAEIREGNEVEFIFENINLPYEAQDEEGSNGFIAYKIKPITGTQIGDFIIGNEAYIYFDYNLPIITNTTFTEVVEDTSSVSVHNLNDLISVYPNPTNGVLHISSKENISLEEIKIYNLQGRELFGSVQNLETIHVENLSSGIYLMNIRTNQGTISKRIIRK